LRRRNVATPAVERNISGKTNIAAKTSTSMKESLGILFATEPRYGNRAAGTSLVG
jgi:hypothetical protein